MWALNDISVANYCNADLGFFRGRSATPYWITLTVSVSLGLAYLLCERTHVVLVTVTLTLTCQGKTLSLRTASYLRGDPLFVRTTTCLWIISFVGHPFLIQGPPTCFWDMSLFVDRLRGKEYFV